MQQFEFRAFPEGGVVEQVSFERLKTDSAARAKAGRLAKRVDGPVDLALAGAAEWDERYITTANPSTFHSTGYRFERLT